MPKTVHTSVFATDHTSAEDVSKLIETGVPAYDPVKEKVDWEQVDSGEIGYSRGWLIVARAWVEQNTPEDVTTLPDPTKFDSKEAYEHKVGQIVSKLRNDRMLSWGKISVLCGVPESFVRKCYTKVDVQKDKGLRIGKGGRFAYDDPQLYLDNRKKEGARIPKEIKGKPAIEQLLNFVPKEGDTNAATKGRAISKIVKAQALRDDKATPAEQKEAIDAQITDLMNKYGITVADITRWKAHRDTKKGRAA